MITIVVGNGARSTHRVGGAIRSDLEGQVTPIPAMVPMLVYEYAP